MPQKKLKKSKMILSLLIVVIFFSALDAESEFLVQDALEKLMVDRTVITIAHRLSTIRSANQIAVLDLGAVAELGPYQELMKIQNGIFRKLVERQDYNTVMLLM